MSYGGLPVAHEQQRPRMVEIGAGLLAIVGVLTAGRVAYGVLLNLGQDGWNPGARAVFLLLNSVVLTFAVFVLVLAYQVRKGRLWAWIVSLVLLPFTILFGGLLVLITALSGRVPFAGAGVLATSLAALLVLTVPRTVRGHLLRKPAPVAPWQAGGGLAQWGPGHPPA